MQRESKKYLDDMLDCAAAIQGNAKDRTLEDFLSDRNFRDAVMWNFCIVGEALSQLRHIDPDTAERITEYWKIIGFRNQLIHGYVTIEHSVTWRVIQNDLPILIKELKALLAE